MPFPIQKEKYFKHLEKHEDLIGRPVLQSFGCYSQINSKSGNLSTKDLFMKQLLCVRYLTPEKVEAIVSQFPSFMSLWRHLKSIKDIKAREEVFKEWIVGSQQRRFGMALSRRITQLFSSSKYDT